MDCPWILWAFYWFKILISIVAIEFAINTHSMEFLGHPAWNSVDSCGQELRIPWTDSMELPPKVGTVTESIRNPYGMSTDKKMEFGWACHPKCIPQKFQNLSTDVPWNPAESMESTEFRRKRWGTVKYSLGGPNRAAAAAGIKGRVRIVGGGGVREVAIAGRDGAVPIAVVTGKGL